MPETTHSADQEIKQQLISFKKLISSPIENPRTVIFVPPIGGEVPSPAILSRFATSGSDVWYANINRYGEALSKYVAGITEEKDRMEKQGELYVVGYSTGCPLAAEFGKSVGLTKEHVILVGPCYPSRSLVKTRARAIGRRVIHRFTTNQADRNVKLGDNFGYFNRNIPLLIRRNAYTNWKHLNEMGLITRKQLDYGIVVSGGRDVISPRTGHTNILVPEADHKFEDMTEAVVQHIRND